MISKFTVWLYRVEEVEKFKRSKSQENQYSNRLKSSNQVETLKLKGKASSWSTPLGIRKKAASNNFFSSATLGLF